MDPLGFPASYVSLQEGSKWWFRCMDFAKDSPGPSPSRLRKAGVAASGTEDL